MGPNKLDVKLRFANCMSQLWVLRCVTNQNSPTKTRKQSY